MIPLFPADGLLPRTLLTVISKCHMIDAYSIGCFPPDALLANLCHFMKKEVTMSDLKSVSKDLVILVDVIGML